MQPSLEAEKYINELLADLNLSEASEQEKEQAVAMLSERFQQIIFNTTLRLLNDEQKVQYLQAAQDPEKNERQIIELSSQVSGLSEALETALLYEFEALKRAMKS